VNAKSQWQHDAVVQGQDPAAVADVLDAFCQSTDKHGLGCALAATAHLRECFPKLTVLQVEIAARRPTLDNRFTVFLNAIDGLNLSPSLTVREMHIGKLLIRLSDGTLRRELCIARLHFVARVDGQDSHDDPHDTGRTLKDDMDTIWSVSKSVSAELCQAMDFPSLEVFVSFLSEALLRAISVLNISGKIVEVRAVLSQLLEARTTWPDDRPASMTQAPDSASEEDICVLRVNGDVSPDETKALTGDISSDLTSSLESGRNTTEGRPASPKADVFVALGSNVGDRLEAIEAACRAIDEDDDMRVVRTSSLYETEPMYVKDQARFINGVCQVGQSVPLRTVSLLIAPSDRNFITTYAIAG
jgi:hypothetical protein